MRMKTRSFLHFFRARVAQEAERVLGKDEVGGSSPPAGSLLVLLLFFSLNGCFFGTFQTARAVRPGHSEWGFFVNYPLYATRQDRQRAEAEGTVYGLPNFGGHLLYGIGPGLDGGLRGSLGEGLGPVLRFQWLGQALPSALNGMIAGYLGYHPVAAALTWRTDLLFSFDPSRYSSIYGGFTLVRMPDYAHSPATGLSKFNEAFAVEALHTYRALYLGVRMMSRRATGSWPPAGLALEVTFPLEGSPIPVIFGFQFTL